MKIIENYMNDPAIADEPLLVREIHAARLMIQDERKNMTAREFSQAAEDATIAIFKKYDLPLVWADLKPIKPRQPVTQ
jgi:hypothetical protein